MNFLDILKKKKSGEEPVSEEKIDVTKKTDESRQFVEGLVSIKDIIAPSAIEVDFNHIRIDNIYYRTCFVAGYPRFVGLNWLSSLINFDASLKISMYIYPTDGKEILDDLRRKIAEMEAELSTDIQRGKVVNPATQAKLEDALNLQTDLVKGEERFFQFGLYMTLSAKTKEKLDSYTKNLESALGALMIVSKKASLQMEEGFVTTLPICSDRLNITRNMDTTSLASTFPFVSSDLSDDKGVMFGINEHNGSLVIFDRFSMQNYNSVVFASAGAGKSYMIKLEVMRSLMLGTDIIVIDPENEYRSLAESVGGQYIAFGYGEESKINPFDLSLVVEEGENALNDKILTLHKMFKIMLGAMDPIEESILDKAVMEAYKAKGITPDPETQNKEAPLIEDLYKALLGAEEEKAKNLAARLEKYIKGSFAGIFNQKTTVNLDNSFVVFGIRNLEESLRPVAMHIILDYIWTIVKRELKKRILVVDEAWYLMQYDDSAAFLRGIVKRGRKYYLGVTTITQDVDDFLNTPFGKEIVTNSAIQILLKQHSAAIDLIGETFYLSEGERQLLLSADKGEGIFFAGQNHVAIQVIASEEEHNLITSNPEDLLRKKIADKQAALVKKEEKTVNPPATETGSLEEKKPDLTKSSVETKEEIINEIPDAEKKESLEAKKEEILQPEVNPPSMEKAKEEIINEVPDSGNKEMEQKVMASPPATEALTEIKTEENLNPSPVMAESVPDSPLVTNLDDQDEGKSGIVEEKPKVLFKSEVEESPEEALQKRIAQMEEEEDKKIEEHQKTVQTEISNNNNKQEGGSLPKYQELFKSPPPLPPLPKFEAPKQSGSNLPKFEDQKASFLTQQKEAVIPQPPQLAKKAKAEFIKKEESLKPEENETTITNSNPTEERPEEKMEEIKAEENLNPSPTASGSPSDSPLPTALDEQNKGDKKKEEAKMTYDKLFGNDNKV